MLNLRDQFSFDGENEGTWRKWRSKTRGVREGERSRRVKEVGNSGKNPFRERKSAKSMKKPIA